MRFRSTASTTGALISSLWLSCDSDLAELTRPEPAALARNRAFAVRVAQWEMAPDMTVAPASQLGALLAGLARCVSASWREQAADWPVVEPWYYARDRREPAISGAALGHCGEQSRGIGML